MIKLVVCMHQIDWGHLQADTCPWSATGRGKPVMHTDIQITTLWTAARVTGGGRSATCDVGDQCPGVHEVAGWPSVLFVISQEVDDVDLRTSWAVKPGDVLGAVPTEMSPDGYLVSTPVEDKALLEAFAGYIAPGEVLGTVPVGSIILREMVA